MSIPRPMPPYFLIKSARKEEDFKKKKIGSIIIPETETFMLYNLQAGEIVGIGAKAHDHFPEAKIGDILLIHHFVQGINESEAKEDHLIFQDDEFNYYVVAAFDFHGKGNETYGVWDGIKIIPNKNYIFLHPQIKADPQSADDYINSALKKTTSGIFLFSQWQESRESKAEKMQRIKRDIEELSKSGAQKPHIAKGIMEKETELQRLSLDINTRSYQPYKVCAYHPSLKEALPSITEGSEVFLLNIAAQTEVDFNGNRYIVCKTDYIGCAH